jgi:hypothetical protein
MCNACRRQGKLFLWRWSAEVGLGICVPYARFECYAPSETQFLPLTQNLSLFTLQRHNINTTHWHFSRTIENLQYNFSCFNRCRLISYVFEINDFCNIKCPGKRFDHQFYACDFTYHKSTIYRVRNLLILKIRVLLLVAAPPYLLRPRQLPYLPTRRPASGEQCLSFPALSRFQITTVMLRLYCINCSLNAHVHAPSSLTGWTSKQMDRMRT